MDDRAWESCQALSFDPLGVSVPACTTLIDDQFAPALLRVEALAHRARAFDLATTYSSDHDVTDEWLRRRVATDFARAIELARTIDQFDSARLGQLLARSGDAFGAIGEVEMAIGAYSEAIKLGAEEPTLLFASRAKVFASASRFDEAIADMSRAIEIAARSNDANLHNLVFLRGEMYEGNGNSDKAAEDYRTTLAEDPEHIGAKRAMSRLSPAR